MVQSAARRARPPALDAQPAADAVSSAEAHMAVAASISDLAKAVREHTEQRKPADEFFVEVVKWQASLCDFLRKKAPWLIMRFLLLLVALGAITPNAADLLKTILAAFGVPVDQ